MAKKNYTTFKIIGILCLAICGLLTMHYLAPFPPASRPYPAGQGPLSSLSNATSSVSSWNKVAIGRSLLGAMVLGVIVILLICWVKKQCFPNHIEHLEIVVQNISPKNSQKRMIQRKIPPIKPNPTKVYIDEIVDQIAEEVVSVTSNKGSYEGLTQLITRYKKGLLSGDYNQALRYQRKGKKETEAETLIFYLLMFMNDDYVTTNTNIEELKNDISHLQAYLQVLVISDIADPLATQDNPIITSKMGIHLSHLTKMLDNDKNGIYNRMLLQQYKDTNKTAAEVMLEKLDSFMQKDSIKKNTSSDKNIGWLKNGISDLQPHLCKLIISDIAAQLAKQVEERNTNMIDTLVFQLTRILNNRAIQHICGEALLQKIDNKQRYVDNILNNLDAIKAKIDINPGFRILKKNIAELQVHLWVLVVSYMADTFIKQDDMAIAYRMKPQLYWLNEMLANDKNGIYNRLLLQQRKDTNKTAAEIILEKLDACMQKDQIKHNNALSSLKQAIDKLQSYLRELFLSDIATQLANQVNKGDIDTIDMLVIKLTTLLEDKDNKPIWQGALCQKRDGKQCYLDHMLSSLGAIRAILSRQQIVLANADTKSPLGSLKHITND